MRNEFKKGRLIIGLCLILIAVISLVFVIHSVAHGLPADGQWKGNIHQWKPHYAGEGLVIVFVGILFAFSFLGGIILSIIAFRQDFWWK